MHCIYEYGIYRVRRQHLNLDKGLDKLGEIPDLNLGDLGKFRWWRFVGLNRPTVASLAHDRSLKG